jgi:hypothetical protein
MAKVVYNACYGGFSLSAEAVRLGKSYSPDDSDWQEVDEEYGFFEGPRHHPTLVRVVEQLCDAANGSYARLRIEELPSGTLYRIDEYDGLETVATQDTYDWTVAP